MNRTKNLADFIPRKALFLAGLIACAGSLPAQDLNLGDIVRGNQGGASGQIYAPDAKTGLSASPSSSLNTPPTLPESRGLFEAFNETTYVVGPGDYFHIAIGKEQFYLAVSPEGYILPQGLPAVEVNGKTLLEAKARIARSFSQAYRRDQIHVSLVQTKKFQVSVSGGVAKPGLYLLDEGVRLSTLVDLAGGFTTRASRSIRLERAKGVSETVDLQEYFSGTRLDKNPYLRQGDRVFVETIDASAPMVYVREERGTRFMPFQEGETLERFIIRYDGFKDVREWTVARIYGADGKYLESVARADAAKYRMRAGITLEMQAYRSIIFVGGMVVRPGYLDYNPSLSLMDYLSLAGIMVGTADVRRSYILDAEGKRRKGNVFRDPLRPGDHILVPRSAEALTRDYIGIFASISSLAVAIATFVVLTK